MKRKIILSLSLLVIIALLALSKKSIGNPIAKCQNSTVVLTNTIYNNTFDISVTGLNFFSNTVCDATSYVWGIDGFTIATTSTPFLTLDAADFTSILPLGGCSIYNSRISNGTYSTTLTIQANAGAQNVYTIPIYVQNVSPIPCLGGGFGG